MRILQKNGIIHHNYVYEDPVYRWYVCMYAFVYQKYGAAGPIHATFAHSQNVNYQHHLIREI